MKITFFILLSFLFITKAISQIDNHFLKIGEIAPKIVGVD